MYKHPSFLISGDAGGEIRIRDCENYAIQLEGKVIPDSKPQGLAAAVTQVQSLTVLETGGNPIIVAGDYTGQITLLTADAQRQTKCQTFGAHKDKQGAIIVKIFQLPDNGGLVSLDSLGRFRLWTGNA